MKIIYTAQFIKNIPELLERFKPMHPKTYGHHSTIEYMPQDLEGIELGRESTLKIVGRASDDKGDVLLVENPKSTKPYPHITLSCSEDTKPVYSEELIAQALKSNTIKYFDTPEYVEVIEGYFDGDRDVIS